MIDDVNSGKTHLLRVLHRRRSKEQQAGKSNTGLFFFRGKPGAPFAVISPGGGFSYVGSIHEGFPYAAAISKQGYNAFVLKYRVGRWRRPRHARSRSCDLLCVPERQGAWRWHSGLFLVGQLRRRENGGCHRIARGGEIRRGRRSKAGSGGHGVYRPLGVFDATNRPPLSLSVSAMELPLHR